MKEFSAEKKKAENGEGSEKNGAEFECHHRVAEEPEGECLEVDEESLAAEIRGIEEFESMRLESMKSIDTVGRFIGVEADRDGFEMIDAEREGEEKEYGELEYERKVRSKGLPHREVSKENI